MSYFAQNRAKISNDYLSSLVTNNQDLHCCAEAVSLYFLSLTLSNGILYNVVSSYTVFADVSCSQSRDLWAIAFFHLAKRIIKGIFRHHPRGVVAEFLSTHRISVPVTLLSGYHRHPKLAGASLSVDWRAYMCQWVCLSWYTIKEIVG